MHILKIKLIILDKMSSRKIWLINPIYLGEVLCLHLISE